jgi:sarcosine oxidase, subunit gamma
MSEPMRRVSPLSNFASPAVLSDRAEAGVILTERAFCGHLNLRGNPNDPAFIAGAERSLGLALPLQTNTVSANSAVTALCLGPDEWLLITPPSTEHEFAYGLRDTLRGLLFAVTNITDGQTIFRLSGSSAMHVLHKGCSLDLHPRTFRPGCCAQTLVAKAGVLIHYVDESPSFELVVRRSFAEYITLWLKDAATEYGFRVI